MKTFLPSKYLRMNYSGNILDVSGMNSRLLSWFSPSYYHYGVYGWNYDTYIFNDLALCYGYRSIPKSKRVSHALCHKYDELAKNICAKAEAEKLMESFIKEALGRK